MSIRTIEKKVAFGKTFAFGESGEVAPTDAYNVATDEPNAALTREQADRQALERAENEGMSVCPD
jgi:phage terminase Nu1 subunit (DNA packaging protein)